MVALLEAAHGTRGIDTPSLPRSLKNRAGWATSASDAPWVCLTACPNAFREGKADAALLGPRVLATVAWSVKQQISEQEKEKKEEEEHGTERK